MKYKYKRDGKTHKGEIISSWKKLPFGRYISIVDALEAYQPDLIQVSEDEFMSYPEIGEGAVVYKEAGGALRFVRFMQDGKHTAEDGTIYEVEGKRIVNVNTTTPDHKRDMLIYQALTGLSVAEIEDLPIRCIKTYFKLASQFVYTDVPHKKRHAIKVAGKEYASLPGLDDNGLQRWIDFENFVLKTEVDGEALFERLVAGEFRYLLDLAACWLHEMPGGWRKMEHEDLVKAKPPHSFDEVKKVLAGASVADIFGFWAWFNASFAGFMKAYNALFSPRQTSNEAYMNYYQEYAAQYGWQATMEELGYKTHEPGDWQKLLNLPIKFVFSTLIRRQDKAQAEKKAHDKAMKKLQK